MTRLSPMRCSRNVINQSLGIVSKYARRSAVGYPADLAPFYPEGQGIERIVRAPPRSEPVAEAKKLHLVDRCQDHIHNRFLDDLVLQRRDPRSGRVPPLRLGYLYPPNRRRPVRSPAVQTPVQVEQALIQTFAIHIPRDAVSTPAAASRFSAWNARCSASGVMWWKSAVRCSFGSLSAAFRIRAAACGTLARH